MIDVNKVFGKRNRRPTVCYPMDVDRTVEQELWGYYHKNSNYYNVISYGKPSVDMGGVSPKLLGHFYKSKPDAGNSLQELYAYCEGDEIFFIASDGRECEQEPVRLKMDIF